MSADLPSGFRTAQRSPVRCGGAQRTLERSPVRIRRAHRHRCQDQNHPEGSSRRARTAGYRVSCRVPRYLLYQWRLEPPHSSHRRRAATTAHRSCLQSGSDPRNMRVCFHRLLLWRDNAEYCPASPEESSRGRVKLVPQSARSPQLSQELTVSAPGDIRQRRRHPPQRPGPAGGRAAGATAGPGPARSSCGSQRRHLCAASASCHQ